MYFSQSIRVELQEPRENNQTGSKAELSVHRGPGIYGRITVPFTITTLSGQLTVDVSPASGNIFFEDRQVCTKSCNQNFKAGNIIFLNLCWSILIEV